jgi:pimeloyl-ACP methyl ester carboxylesterase
MCATRRNAASGSSRTTGRATPAPDRSVADAAADVRTVADALGVEKLAVWGISGGGPHALACAALLADRVVAVASLASVAPTDGEGLDWLDGMGELNLEEFAVTRQGREALAAYLEPKGREDATAEGIVEELQSLLSDADAAVLTGELGEYLAENMNEAVRPGIDGWLDDDLAFDRGASQSRTSACPSSSGTASRTASSRSATGSGSPHASQASTRI